MTVLGGVVLHAGVVAHLFCIFLHVVRGLVRNDSFSFDGLVDVRGQVDRTVLVNFPGTAVTGGEQIFVSAASFGQASGDGAHTALRVRTSIVLRESPHRSQS